MKNEAKADAERDLRNLISAAGADVAEKARRERLLRHFETAEKAHPLNWQSTLWNALECLLRRWTTNNDIAETAALESRNDQQTATDRNQVFEQSNVEI